MWKLPPSFYYCPSKQHLMSCGHLPAAAAGSGLLCVGVLWHSHVTAEHLGSIRHSRIYGKQDSIGMEKSFWFQNSFKFLMGELETENLGVSCGVLSGALLLFQNILVANCIAKTTGVYGCASLGNTQRSRMNRADRISCIFLKNYQCMSQFRLYSSY